MSRPEMDFESYYRGLMESWFLSEPLLFDVMCAHSLVRNERMTCNLRIGEQRLEYNPLRLGGKSGSELETLVEIEAVRVLLKHPYQRRPLNARLDAMLIASDLTISEHYHKRSKSMYTRDSWRRPSAFNIPPRLSYEEYYALVCEVLASMTADEQMLEPDMPEGGDKQWKRYQDYTPKESQTEGEGDEMIPFGIDGNRSIPGSGLEEMPSADNAEELAGAADKAALWNADPLMSERIDDMVDRAEQATATGSVKGSVMVLIKQAREIPLNVGAHLSRFRTSVISTSRTLTRMRPSRRYGFAQMGVRHPYSTRILVGIDTSASVPMGALRQFLGVINHFFKQGVEQIDVLAFDADLQLPVQTMRQAAKSIKLSGRGSTHFQPIIDYYCASDYDGLIVFTDGEASDPIVPEGKKVLWVLSSKWDYQRFRLEPKLYIPTLPHNANRD